MNIKRSAITCGVLLTEELSTDLLEAGIDNTTIGVAGGDIYGEFQGANMSKHARTAALDGAIRNIAAFLQALSSWIRITITEISRWH